MGKRLGLRPWIFAFVEVETLKKSGSQWCFETVKLIGVLQVNQC